MPYVYQVVFEFENDEHEIVEESEYIVATNIEDVFVKAKVQVDDMHELIAIVRRHPIVCVLGESSTVEKGE